MQVALELPEDIAAGLQAKWKDLPRHALEALALEGPGALGLRNDPEQAEAPPKREPTHSHDSYSFDRPSNNEYKLGFHLPCPPAASSVRYGDADA